MLAIRSNREWAAGDDWGKKIRKKTLNVWIFYVPIFMMNKNPIFVEMASCWHEYDKTYSFSARKSRQRWRKKRPEDQI
ncbi:MAG: hypothetical protein ACFFDT_20085 [Candidatus Hodarchaeota archaeon]